MIIINKLPRIGTYLYLMCFEGRPQEPVGPVKIGITSNLVTRLASVQTGQHRRIQVLAAFGTPNREIARARETEWHQQFDANRLQGEWFDIDPIRALNAMCAGWRHYLQNLPECIELMGIPFYEREVKVMRAWREHYAENSNVVSISKVG